jgi:hypothetical protein
VPSRSDCGLGSLQHRLSHVLVKLLKRIAHYQESHAVPGHLEGSDIAVGRRVEGRNLLKHKVVQIWTAGHGKLLEERINVLEDICMTLPGDLSHVPAGAMYVSL